MRRRSLGTLALLTAALACTDSAAPLAPGTREHELRGGEVHRYQVRLAAGELLRVVVEEQGIDVNVHLLGPDGAEVVYVDGDWPLHLPEELAAVADRPGTYEIQVRSLSGKPPGRYRLTLDPAHPATGRDRLYAEAVRRAQAALETAAKKNLPRAQRLAGLAAVLDHWHRLGERGREAEILYQVGGVYKVGRDYKKDGSDSASAAHHRAAEIWASLGDSRHQALALWQAGLAERAGDRLKQARSDLERAGTLAGAAGDDWLQGAVLNALGRLLLDSGEAAAARETLSAALRPAERAGDPETTASILNNLAGAHETLGEIQEALECYDRALPIATGSDLAATHNNRGVFYQSLGEWGQALSEYQQALEIQPSPELRALTLNNLGVALFWSGEPRKALDPLREALAFGERHNVQVLRVRARTNLAFAFIQLDDSGRARALAERALAAAKGRNDFTSEALASLAQAHLALGERATARTELLRAIDLARQSRYLPWQANAELLLARLDRAEGSPKAALAHIASGIDIVESERIRVLSPYLRATLLAFRQPFYELKIDLLMELATLSGDARWLAEALAASEQAKARSFLDLVSRAGADVRKGAPPALLARRSELRQRLSSLENGRLELLSAGAPPPEVARAERQVEAALGEYNHAEEDLLARSPRYRSLARPALLDLGAIQRDLLDADSLLLEYALGKEHSYLWAVTRDEARTYELPPRERIEAVARRLYGRLIERNQEAPPGETSAQRRERVARADAGADADAAELGALVIGPAARLMPGKRILVVPDGALHFVPFSALAVQERPGAPPEPLVEGHEVVLLPSASAFAALRQEHGRPEPAQDLALFADPVFNADDERLAGKVPTPLPGASASRSPGGQSGGGARGRRQAGAPEMPYLEPIGEQEALAISKLVPADRAWIATGFAASRNAVLRGDLARYRYVHFATHGRIDNQRPELSALVLSRFDPRGRSQDGSVRLADVYDLDLDADLVVLSACETALGREIQGEGLIGLTRGFLYAGAGRVVSSLWSVDELATTRLMRKFYRHLLHDAGSSPAAALRAAQKDLRRQQSSPYYWAAFSLQGEWK